MSSASSNQRIGQASVAFNQTIGPLLEGFFDCNIWGGGVWSTEENGEIVFRSHFYHRLFDNF